MYIGSSIYYSNAHTDFGQGVANLQQGFLQSYAKVTHSRIGLRISHGYNPESFVAIRIGP